MDFNSIVRRTDMSRGATANGLKQIEMLGFASIDMGPSPRFIRTMKLSDRWQHRRGRSRTAATEGKAADGRDEAGSGASGCAACAAHAVTAGPALAG